jgi:hypothetical protein
MNFWYFSASGHSEWRGRHDSRSSERYKKYISPPPTCWPVDGPHRQHGAAAAAGLTAADLAA